MNWSMRFPALVEFGPGSAEKCGGLLRRGPVLFCAGRHLDEQYLRRLAGKRPVAIFRASGNEPTLEDVDRASELARSVAADSVVGIGGGSAIDTAKAVSVVSVSGGRTEDFFYGRRTLSGSRRFFIAIPTTAGTGAEATSNAVLTDPATGIKQSLKNPAMLADAALVDPDLLADCPLRVAAASGFDALTQAIEGYCSLHASSATRAWALEAAKLLLNNLLRFCRDTGNAEARNAVAEASLLAGLAFAQSGLGAVHGIGHPVGSRLHWPHGEVCVALLVEVLLRNSADSPAPAQLALEFGLKSPAELAAIIADLRRALGLPENFHGALKATDYDFILANCRSGSMKCNPKFYSDAEVVELLRALS